MASSNDRQTAYKLSVIKCQSVSNGSLLWYARAPPTHTHHRQCCCGMGQARAQSSMRSFSCLPTTYYYVCAAPIARCYSRTSTRLARTVDYSADAVSLVSDMAGDPCEDWDALVNICRTPILRKPQQGTRFVCSWSAPSISRTTYPPAAYPHIAICPAIPHPICGADSIRLPHCMLL